MIKRIFMVLLLVFIAFSLLGCENINDRRIQIDEPTTYYEIFYIEGMPCVRSFGYFSQWVILYDGISCDWSEWKGK